VDSSLHTLVDTNVIETESLNYTSDLDSKEEPQNIEETATANTEESQKEPKVLTKEEEDALLLAEYEQELQEQAKRQNALKSPPRESALETIVEGPEDPDEAIAQQKLQEMKKYGTPLIVTSNTITFWHIWTFRTRVFRFLPLEEEKARERLLATALRAEVLYDFTTTEENKLNLKVGDVIIVLEVLSTQYRTSPRRLWTSWVNCVKYRRARKIVGGWANSTERPDIFLKTIAILLNPNVDLL